MQLIFNFLQDNSNRGTYRNNNYRKYKYVIEKEPKAKLAHRIIKTTSLTSGDEKEVTTFYYQ